MWLETLERNTNVLCVFLRMSELSSEREQAATPTLEKRDINWNQLNESIMSGYEGDKEDEEDSFFERGTYFYSPKLRILENYHNFSHLKVRHEFLKNFSVVLIISHN